MRSGPTDAHTDLSPMVVIPDLVRIIDLFGEKLFGHSVHLNVQLSDPREVPEVDVLVLMSSGVHEGEAN